MCELQRWREVNLALDGLGYFARRGGRVPGGRRAPSDNDVTWLETVLRTEPDLVTVCLGLNDSEYLPSQRSLVERAIRHDLGFLATRVRGVPTVVAPYFPALGVGPRFQAVRRLVHEVATELGLPSTDAMSEAIDGDTDMLALDGIHPNDVGHAAIARANDEHALRIAMRQQRHMGDHLLIGEFVGLGDLHHAVEHHDAAMRLALEDHDVLEG